MSHSTVPVRRQDGSRASVQVANSPHFLVDVWDEVDESVEHVLVAAPTAKAAKALAVKNREVFGPGEVWGCRKADRPTVAVLVLNGTTVVR